MVAHQPVLIVRIFKTRVAGRLLTKSLIVNPHGKDHGAPSDTERHVGDLGNFKTDGQGNSQGSVEDKFIKLIGPESVIGVCFSRHKKEELALTKHAANCCCSRRN